MFLHLFYSRVYLINSVNFCCIAKVTQLYIYTLFYISFPLWFMEATEIIMPNSLDKTSKILVKEKVK